MRPNAAARNIELKARLTELDSARSIANQIATERLGAQRQVDTYFHCALGRLKLRQSDVSSAQLVWYLRDDTAGPKSSDYHLVEVSHPEALKQVLAGALGILTVVEKRREVYLWENVRIHLDDVTGLGCFLEFEAVLAADVDDNIGHGQLAHLASLFQIREQDLVHGSYSDLLLDQTGS